MKKIVKALVFDPTYHLLRICFIFFSLLLRIQPNFSSVIFVSLILILFALSCLPLVKTTGGSFGVPHELYQSPQINVLSK